MQKSDAGMAIRVMRTVAGLSQWQLAAKVGSHPSAINLIEKGKREPDPALVERCIKECERTAKSPIATEVLKAARRALEPVAA